MDPGVRRIALERAHRVLESEIRAIEVARDRVGETFVDAIEAISHALDRGGRICLTGVGKARLVGEKIQATLASTGAPAYSLHPVEALHGDIGMVSPNDIVIGLSKSGGSELVRLLPDLRRVGCPVILITATPQSPAARHADVVLDIGDAPEACPLGLAPSSSTTAMLAIGDALALTLMDLRSFDQNDFAQRHPGGALGRALARVRDLARTGKDCPTTHVGASMAECYDAISKAPRRAGAAIIVDDLGRLCGIVTLGDFFRAFANHDSISTRCVADFMSPDPKCVAADARVGEALELMRLDAIDELAVVEADGTLFGLIDIQDLIAPR